MGNSSLFHEKTSSPKPVLVQRVLVKSRVGGIMMHEPHHFWIGIQVMYNMNKWCFIYPEVSEGRLKKIESIWGIPLLLKLRLYSWEQFPIKQCKNASALIILLPFPYPHPPISFKKK